MSDEFGTLGSMSSAEDIDPPSTLVARPGRRGLVSDELIFALGVGLFVVSGWGFLTCVLGPLLEYYGEDLPNSWNEIHLILREHQAVGVLILTLLGMVVGLSAIVGGIWLGRRQRAWPRAVTLGHVRANPKE